MALPKRVRDAAGKVLKTQTARSEPLWKGPEEDGITFSMLSRFLVCRERFRLYALEGLRPVRRFNHRIEYGEMWHVCEEALASERGHFGEIVGTTLWQDKLYAYTDDLSRQYPFNRPEILHWYNVCRVQFPEYVRHWECHPDSINRRPLMQEQVFDVPYKLPSGRTVRLRGKWDSVDLVKNTKEAGIWIQENKTKGDVYEPKLTSQLTFDLQSMIYLVAFVEAQKWDLDDKNAPSVIGVLFTKDKGHPLSGVRYNVCRRPLSGGKDNIRQHKPSRSNPGGESASDYYDRLRGLIAEDPSYYFMRWNVSVTERDITKFRRECFDPVLEQLCDWYDFVAHPNHPDHGGIWGHSRGTHWRHPWGVWNVLNEGGSHDLDEYLSTGNSIGLEKVERLFEELTE